VRAAGLLVMFGALFAPAQVPGLGPRWFVSSRGMLGRPAANADFREIERLERYLYFGVPYCGGLAPSAYAANVDVARQMSAYLGTVQTAATDPQARVAAARVAAAFGSFPCAYPGRQLPVITGPPPKPGDPPFALRSPDLGKVPDAEQETAADLQVRYDTDAARSASVWKSAETMRISLSGRGMSLNADTATAVGRLGPLYKEAADALQAHKWDDALSTLQAAEGTTQKVAKVVGN
jgi:hypothetical protein